MEGEQQLFKCSLVFDPQGQVHHLSAVTSGQRSSVETSPLAGEWQEEAGTITHLLIYFENIATALGYDHDSRQNPQTKE